MSKVVSLDKHRLENGSHLTGEAVCQHCQHEWLAMVPVGTIELECPQCRAMKGVMRHGSEPEIVWACRCGCHLFTLSGISHEMICWNCGEYQVFGSDK